jgi:hypothetical protein
MLLGATAKNSERFFSSGNERTPAILPDMAGGDKVGYKLNPKDKFAMIVDLMNENMEDKVVYLTITYDFLPTHPADYDDMKPIWFDLAQCGDSEVQPPKQSGNWTKDYTWTSSLSGEILGTAGVCTIIHDAMIY